MRFTIFKLLKMPENGFAGVFVISILSLAAFATISGTVLYQTNRAGVAVYEIKRNHEMLDVMELLAYEMQKSIAYDGIFDSSTENCITNTGINETASTCDLSSGNLAIKDDFDGCIEYDGVDFCGQFYRATRPSTPHTIPTSTNTTTTTVTQPTVGPDVVVSIGIIDGYSSSCGIAGGREGSPVCRTCNHKNSICIDIVVCKDAFNTRPSGTRAAPCTTGSKLYYVQTVLLDIGNLGITDDREPNVIKVKCNDYKSATNTSTDYYSMTDSRIYPYANFVFLDNNGDGNVDANEPYLKKTIAPPMAENGGNYYVVIEDSCFTECPTCSPPTSPTSEEDCPRCNKVSGGSCSPKTCSDFGSGLHSEDGSDGDTTYSSKADDIKENCFNFAGAKCTKENGSSLRCYLHTPSDPVCTPPSCTQDSDCSGLAGICPDCTDLCTTPSGGDINVDTCSR